MKSDFANFTMAGSNIKIAVNPLVVRTIIEAGKYTSIVFDEQHRVPVEENLEEVASKLSEAMI